MLILRSLGEIMGKRWMFGVQVLFCTFFSVVCLHSGLKLKRVYLMLFCMERLTSKVSHGHQFLSAKDLVRKMLTQDPKKRITSAQVLQHPWLREGEASDKPIDSAVLSRMKQFRALNKLKKMALKVIA